MKKRRWLIIGIVVAAITILIVPPYLSWLSHEPDVVVVPVAKPQWDYPWDRGLEISVDWSTSIYEKDEYPYASTRSPATGLKTVELSVSYIAFDLVDVWLPWDTEEYTPDKPSFTDYLVNWYGFSTGEVIPTDSLAYATLTCLFVYSEGSMAGTKEWIDLVPDDPSAKNIIYRFDEEGFYSDSFVLYRRSYSGTYTFTLAVTAVGDGTIGDDSETFTYVNRY
jgi:hypothetical protein